MDGRLKRWALGGLAALALPAVGCRLFPQKTPAEQQFPTAAGVIQQASHRQPVGKFTPAEAPTQPHVSKKGQPLKAETSIAIADVELEAAFDETRTGPDRDRIIDVARRRLQDVLARDPKNKAALLELAKLYTWANDRDRALATYQKALAFYPKDQDVPYALMRAQARFEDWNGACKACEMALVLDKENREYRKAYGVVLARADRWKEAFDVLLGVMSESEARTLLGRMLIDTGRVEEGRKQLEAAVTADSNNTTAREVLTGLAEYQLQQTGGK